MDVTDLRKAAEMALEALEWSWGGEPLGTKEFEAMTALRTALAQPEQEPVAWLEYDDEGYLFLSGKRKGAFPVFTAPPSKPWVGLTMRDYHEFLNLGTFEAFKAIEAKLKEKNYD